MSSPRVLVVLIFILVGCTKIPITDIGARFDRADAAWFADEETLFFFYEVAAEQGLSDASVVEITYRTDDFEQPWASASELELVHEHVAVDCGFKRLCGSLSLHVPIEPRDVQLRLRYHVDGALALGAPTAYNVVGSGPPHSNRSFLVYGVFTGDNRRVQWRGRHRFPTVRNEEAQALGLRRAFEIDEQRYGTAPFDFDGNPYGYAAGCPAEFVGAGLAAVETSDRAVFDTANLPEDAATAAQVCARAMVYEPRAPFVTTAIAQKNPEVEPAFPLLRSPVNAATPVKFHLAPCDRTISEKHDAMQRQRILYDGPTRCTDDWQREGFADQLLAEFRDAVEATRPAGDDMVLVVGLDRDDPRVADLVEEVLARLLPTERNRSTPRLAGAFVFDSEIRDIRDEALRRLVLWCPAREPRDDDPDIDPSQVSCAIAADNLNLTLGPFALSSIPILASRSRYLDFINRYSEGQAGRMKSLDFLVPEFTPTTDNTEVEQGVATFFNGEVISAEEPHVFSYCASDSFQPFVFRSAISRSDELDCPSRLPGGFCLPEPQDFLPIELLPEWHEFFHESTYELGLIWDFPWLLRATYEVVIAASASAFGLSVPFGFGSDQIDDLGTAFWKSETFSLAETLLQCKRFCDHPTFDSAGIYNVTATFRRTYQKACYRPSFPTPGDSSFPSDP